MRESSSVSIQPGLQSALTSSAHELDDFFLVEQIVFKTFSGNVTSETQQHLIYCRSVLGLIEYVKGRRNVQDARLLIGIDGGQGSLKFVLNIEDERRTNKSDFKDSGVKRSLIIALVENVQENYENVSKIWTKLELQRINAVVTGS